MSEEREQLTEEAVRKAAHVLGRPSQEVRPVVEALLADWHVQRHEGAGGVTYIAETPQRPFTQEEEERRRQWRELQEARREWLASEQADPPPPGVDTLDLLGQKTWWRTGDRRIMRLTEMTPSHRSNLLDYMKKNSFRWQFGEYLSFPEAFLDNMPDEVVEEPSDMWVKRKPLYRALRKLVKKDRRAARAE